MDVLFYIKDLLLKRDGLVVSEFGSFVVKNISSKMDQSTKKLIPPHKSIEFNPHITEDQDQILALEISEKEKISLEEANEVIGKKVKEMKEALDQKKKYPVSGLGVFQKDEQGLHFRELQKDLQNFGLEEIDAAPFELDSKPSASKQPARKTPAQPQKATSSNTAKPTQPTRTPKKPSRKKSKTWYWIAGGILILAGIAGGSYYMGLWDDARPLPKKKQVSQAARSQESARKKDQKPAVDLSDDTANVGKIHQSLEKMTDKKKALMYQENQKATEAEKAGGQSYHLVVGSFKRRNNAEEFSRQIKEKGYSPTILEKDGLFRITVKSFNNKQEALVYLYHMRDTGKVKSVWLLTVNEEQP